MSIKIGLELFLITIEIKRRGLREASLLKNSLGIWLLQIQKSKMFSFYSKNLRILFCIIAM
jgi:hypothetical protein